jgi:hypothetical protein
MDNLYFKLKGVEDLTDKIVIVAEVMAKELGKDEVWQKNEIESFKNIAEIYHTHI